MEENKQEKEPLQPIIAQVTDYFETYIRLARYKAIKRGTSLFAGIVIDLFVILGLSLTFLFVSLTLAFYLSHVLGAYWMGFGCISLLYLFIIVVVVVLRAKLEKPIVNVLIRKLFK